MRNLASRCLAQIKNREQNEHTRNWLIDQFSKISSTEQRTVLGELLGYRKWQPGKPLENEAEWRSHSDFLLQLAAHYPWQYPRNIIHHVAIWKERSGLPGYSTEVRECLAELLGFPPRT